MLFADVAMPLLMMISPPCHAYADDAAIHADDADTPCRGDAMLRHAFAAFSPLRHYFLYAADVFFFAMPPRV